MITFEQFITLNNDLIWAIVNNKSRKFYSHNFQKFLYSKYYKEDIYQELITKIFEEWDTYKEDKGAKRITYFTTVCVNYLSTLMTPYGAKKRQLKLITNIDLNQFIDEGIDDSIVDIHLTVDELIRRENIVNASATKKKIIISMLKGGKQSALAIELGVSKQHISKIWGDYIKEMKKNGS